METMINKSPVALTPSAINEIKRLMDEEGFEATKSPSHWC